MNVAALTDDALVQLYDAVVCELATRNIFERVPLPPERELDELEPRRDTIPAPHNPEDDAG